MPLPAILLEDEHLVAFDKPSELPVLSERRGHRSDTLVGMAQEVYGPAVAAVHKLDDGTSGAVLLAKTKQAQDFLSGQFQSKTADSAYLALCLLLPAERGINLRPPARDESGVLLDQFTVEVGMDDDPVNPGKMEVFRRKGGLPTLGSFRVLERFRQHALIECLPRSGRKHQLRAHLAAAAAPILNDPLYGEPGAELKLSSLKRGYKGRADEQPLVRRLALHCQRLTLLHPATRQPFTVEAPLPTDLEVALKYLRKFSSR
jgi:RluA family pseudouridine synthase